MNKRRNWLGLFGANFFGAFNDNFLKNLACFISIHWIAEQYGSRLIALASAMLVIPYILFSPLAGRMCRMYSKRNILVWLKFTEIPIMLLACVGFLTQSLWIVLLAIFLMGFQSAIYSPAKYSLIRDIGGHEGISFGTGTMEMFIFLAVLSATICASLISDHYTHSLVFSIMIGVAIIGYVLPLVIKVKEDAIEDAQGDSLNPITFVKQSFQRAAKIKSLTIVILSVSSFWLIASLLQMNIISHCPHVLNMTNTQTGIVMAITAIGIGLGCYIAGIVSHKQVELGLVTIGGIGLTISIALIAIIEPKGYLFSAFIFIAAFSSGFYKVPLSSWIQDKVEGRVLGEMIAFNNLMDFIFIFVSSGIFYITEPHFGTQGVFYVTAALAAIVSIISAVYIPGDWQRFKNIFVK